MMASTRLFIVLTMTVLILKAQGDGPRAYWPQPNKTNLVTPLYTYVDTNQVFDNSKIINDAEFYTNIYGLMYTRVFSFKKRAAGLVAMLNYGETSGGISGVLEGSTSGFGDLYIIGIINLYGVPSATKEEFIKTKYEYSINLQLACKAPTGKYNASDVLNLGTNRWEIKAGIPFMKFFSWGTPSVTSIEILPTLSFFTVNSDLGNSGDSLKQKPLLAIESHITKQLNKMIWLSLDTMYRTGGQTVLDGVKNDDALNSFQLGGTLGTYFSRELGLKISYGGSVGNTTTGVTGQMFRLMLSYTF